MDFDEVTCLKIWVEKSFCKILRALIMATATWRRVEICSSLLALLAAHHILHVSSIRVKGHFNPLNAELNPICHLLALLVAHHILHVSRVRVKGHFNPLNGELNPICHLLALLGAHHILHVCRVRDKSKCRFYKTTLKNQT